jgi:hypothetical protein
LKLFVKWLNNFISHVKPTTENKVSLVLDSHYKFKEFGGYRDNLYKWSHRLLLQLPGQYSLSSPTFGRCHLHTTETSTSRHSTYGCVPIPANVLLCFRCLLCFQKLTPR